MIPLRTDSPLRKTPWMNYSLIAANVIVFILQQLIWHNNPPHALQPGIFRRRGFSVAVVLSPALFQRVEFLLLAKPDIRTQGFRTGASARLHEPVQCLIERPGGGAP